MGYVALAHWYWVMRTLRVRGIAVVEALVPSLHRPLAPWVSSAMLDRLPGPSHLPSEAGVPWCVVRPQAVLDPLAAQATPRCSVVHGHAGPIDRPPFRQAASCPPPRLTLRASAPARWSARSLGSGWRLDCGGSDRPPPRKVRVILKPIYGSAPRSQRGLT
jgi:hypothetical protein